MLWEGGFADALLRRYMSRRTVRHIRSVVLLIVAVTSLAKAPCAQGLMDQKAPVPSGITSSKTVFVGNGGESDDLLTLSYGLHSDDLYSRLYWDIVRSSCFRVVLSPSDADLAVYVFLDIPERDNEDPRLHLVISDAKTNARLWVITKHVQQHSGLHRRRSEDLRSTIDALVTLFLDLRTIHN